MQGQEQGKSQGRVYKSKHTGVEIREFHISQFDAIAAGDCEDMVRSELVSEASTLGIPPGWLPGVVRVVDDEGRTADFGQPWVVRQHRITGDVLAVEMKLTGYGVPTELCPIDNEGNRSPEQWTPSCLVIVND